MDILTEAIETYLLPRGQGDGKQYSRRGWSVEALLPVVMFVVTMAKHSRMCFYSYVITILGLRALRLWIASCQGHITERLAQQMNDKSTAEPS